VGGITSRCEEEPEESPFVVWEVGVTSFDCNKLLEDGVEGSGGAGPKRDLPVMTLLSRKLSMLFAVFRLYCGTGLEGSPLAGFH
jgi:hypothetical protein